MVDTNQDLVGPGRLSTTVVITALEVAAQMVTTTMVQAQWLLPVETGSRSAWAPTARRTAARTVLSVCIRRSATMTSTSPALETETSVTAPALGQTQQTRAARTAPLTGLTVLESHRTCRSTWTTTHTIATTELLSWRSTQAIRTVPTGLLYPGLCATATTVVDRLLPRTLRPQLFALQSSWVEATQRFSLDRAEAFRPKYAWRQQKKRRRRGSSRSDSARLSGSPGAESILLVNT